MTRKTILLVAFTAVISLLTLGLSSSNALIGSGGAAAFAQAVQKSATFDPAKHEVANLQPIIKSKSLKEGLNLIHITSVEKVSAKVQGGKIVEYSVEEKGRTVRADIHRRSVVTARSAGEETTEGPDVCWACYKMTDGKIHCFKIPCPTR